VLYVPKLRQLDLGDIMFAVGSKVKMSEAFVLWCKEMAKHPLPNKFLIKWVTWENRVLDVLSADFNQYDSNYLDVVTRLEYTDEDPLVISVHKDDFSFCNDKTIIPFVLANGVKLSNNREDRCKECGAPGKIIRMACICSKCGQLVWGI